MKKRILMALAATALIVPAQSALAGSDKAQNIAKKACKQERQEAGKDAFRDTHGKNAMRNCKRAAKGEFKNAAKECKAEREELGKEEFAATYGKGGKGRNAMGKCVVSKVQDSVDAGDGEDTGEEDPPPPVFES